MKKTALFLLFISAVFLSQSCKKDKTTTTTTVSPIFQASIGSVSWVPDTLAATLTYNTITKKKTFTVTGQKTQKMIQIIFTDPTSVDDEGITTGNYKVDGTPYLQFNYSTQVKDASGNYVFEPYGTVQPNSGTFNISSIDTDKKTITGSFNFTASKINYDSNGNIVSINLAAVTSGSMQILPYTFVRQ
ncbi:DUF6252 family protein [Mucilaginibacter phyllosphaerae]|uniref:Uncharacterized protein n=1 Tax=Mucilaginibacter phyllosphaerae TaxID=1812349 RepID=A0A4Y8A7H0_9SPHI|nr:DUF6252 family protein [Mucilaginibacter phyllosphaerae]MBB3970744.1 hypothetical protein [Mucilaginibacter phyllosphaerae]TEW64310.1 hypothetical protein E2R65_18370 [Mucilaginibacter phyllosphaerae]GGH04358.1 hypothetical protein GCM10007352_07490 [Mucilaginibacter phyllosphaerae]